ncbi:hypothetical protein [Haliovirga abyssi]|uniref:Uncharacterized protein n=1 Tax=Haliovirga abyssi TaxID=2996794 RepID=A0AAU9D3E5_9FUSO|nr:hypothetical protein [Haliovirga abyssi]BDU50509.1 hypothetical protein HLVA_10780 [Haliovirga abyssi]
MINKKNILFLLTIILSTVSFSIEYSGEIGLKSDYKDEKLSLNQLYDIRLYDKSWMSKFGNDEQELNLFQKKGNFRFKEYITNEQITNQKKIGATLYYKNYFNLGYLEERLSRMIDSKLYIYNIYARFIYKNDLGAKVESYRLALNKSYFNNILRISQDSTYYTDKRYNMNLLFNFKNFEISTDKTEKKFILKEKFYLYNKNFKLRVSNQNDVNRKKNKKEFYGAFKYKKIEPFYEYVEDSAINKGVVYYFSKLNKIEISWNNLYYKLLYNYGDFYKGLTYILIKDKSRYNNNLTFYYKKDILKNVYYKLEGSGIFTSMYELSSSIILKF